MKISLVALMMVYFLAFSATKENHPVVDVGSEIQVYPAGWIPGVQLERSWTEKHSMNVRLGYNFARHGDLGKKDEERGGGWGFSVGTKRYFKKNFQGFYAGLRADTWFNEIHWKEDPGLPDERAGDTSLVVLQPTAQIGYAFVFHRWIVSPALSFGWEWNVHTQGEPTGEGPILLGGVMLGYRFSVDR